MKGSGAIVCSSSEELQSIALTPCRGSVFGHEKRPIRRSISGRHSRRRACRLAQEPVNREPAHRGDEHLPVGDQRYAELGGEVEGIAARQLVAAVKHGTEIGRVVRLEHPRGRRGASQLHATVAVALNGPQDPMVVPLAEIASVAPG